MKICHAADIQIRFGERLDEFQSVFERFYEDLREQKPDRITLIGDLMHHKIRLSPHSYTLLVSFLVKLSKIAPTDVILGNHDLNLQNLEQGDVITPIVETSKMMGANDTIIEVTKENKEEIDFWKNSIYYYPDSGFYDIGKDIVYGVFSCKDGEILSLDKPDPKKKYIALWHGTLYGSIGDNGYEMKVDDGFNMETFKNFDCVMMGDIHEYQTFGEDERIVYCGSLLQNSFGESIRKGYVMWDLPEFTHQRRLILNDWGYAKLNISRGETIEERIENLEFSNDKKKTKIRVVYEDYSENYSLERERYIRDLIREKYGCSEVAVSFDAIEKEDVDVTDESSTNENLGFIDALTEWIEISDNDISEEETEQLIELAKVIDKKELGINESQETKYRANIEPLNLTISNMFSFPTKKLFIDFQKYKGTMGIFGENYSGKSNFIRAFIWAGWEVVPGNNDSNTIVNKYTKSDKGYTVFEVLINNVKHRITRQIQQKSKGSNIFKRKFEVWGQIEADGKIKEGWKAVRSNETTSEQKEVKRQIEEAVGSYEDFSINSLHIHDSEDDYLNLAQQDKNALFWRYNGLDTYTKRKDFGRKKITSFKKEHANLGKASIIEEELKLKQEELKSKKITLSSLEKERGTNEKRKSDENKKIIDLTSKLEKIQILPFDKKEDIQVKIEEVEENINGKQEKFDELKEWVDKNSKRELPFEITKTIEEIDKTTKEHKESLEKYNKEKEDLNTWIKNNPRKKTVDDSGATKIIVDLQSSVIKLQNDLIVYQGKPCPTCHKATEKPNPVSEKNTIKLIKEKNIVIDEKQKLIKKAEDAKIHNNNLSHKESRLSNVLSNIKQLEGETISLYKEKEMIEKSKDIIEHNEKYDTKKEKKETLQNELNNLQKSLQTFKGQYDIFDENEKNKIKNKETEKLIEDIEEVINKYDLSLSSIGQQINKIIGEISVAENNIETDKSIIDKVREADKNYKIYSLYLQAVERDGIPSMIIKRRLPLINSRINNMVGQIANFRVKLEVDKKGDIKEYFYSMEDERDKLPVKGSGSGMQKFIISLAIKDGLRYISGRYVAQPSVFLIDEGFGTIHKRNLPEMVEILHHIKTKYKNLIMITHVDEIKEAADFIFIASKDRSMISEDELKVDENAGVTKFIRA